MCVSCVSVCVCVGVCESECVCESGCRLLNFPASQSPGQCVRDCACAREEKAMLRCGGYLEQEESTLCVREMLAPWTAVRPAS